MGKHLILIALAILLVSCVGGPKSDRIARVAANNKYSKRAQPKVPITDSAKLVIYLGSLTIPKFPLNTAKLPEATGIDLSAFKSRRLRGLPLKAHEINIGGAIIDGNASYKFDLVDSTFKANWILLARNQRYFAVLIDQTLVTLTYNLKIIDAMHVMANDPAGNSHFHGILNTTIHRNLKLILNYYYEVQVDDKGTYDHQIENDLWLIDQRGYLKFRRTEVVEDTEA